MSARLRHVRTEVTAPQRISTCSPANACRDTGERCAKQVRMMMLFVKMTNYWLIGYFTQYEYIAV